MGDLEAIGTFLREFGLPVLFLVLLVLEIIVPKGRLKREESRGDRAMDLSEQQVAATRELTVMVKAWLDAQKAAK